MRFKLVSRAATVLAVAALTAGGLVMAAGGASASTGVWANTSHGVGVYSQPYSYPWISKVADDLAPYQDEYVDADCWSTGETINNQGDVWYHVSGEHGYPWGSESGQGWVYGAYIDGNAAFHNGSLGHCP